MHQAADIMVAGLDAHNSFHAISTCSSQKGHPREWISKGKGVFAINEVEYRVIYLVTDEK